MPEYDPKMKELADKFGLNYDALAQEAPKIKNFAAENRENVRELSQPNHFENLPDGRYTGKVFINLEQVKKDTNPNYNRLMLKFTLKVTEGEYLGKYDYKNLVVNPSYLDMPRAGQTDEEWRKAKEDYWLTLMKTLQNCGVTVDWENELQTFSNAPDANGNIVQFTAKKTNGNRYVYIDRLIERKEKNESESGASLLDLPDIPDGKDAPFGEATGQNM